MDNMGKVAQMIEAGLNSNRSCGSWTNWVSRAPLRLLGELHYGALYSPT